MKAIIYARVSSTNDRQNTERQVIDLQQYAEANKMEVVKIFEEHISGGKTNKNELSRIGRNTFNVLETIKFLIDNHINLYFQKERFTLLNEDGKPSPFAAIMLATLSTYAELERENIAFRLQSGFRRHIEKGGKVGRKFGYTKSREKKEDKY